MVCSRRERPVAPTRHSGIFGLSQSSLLSPHSRNLTNLAPRSTIGSVSVTSNQRLPLNQRFSCSLLHRLTVRDMLMHIGVAARAFTPGKAEVATDGCRHCFNPQRMDHCFSSASAAGMSESRDPCSLPWLHELNRSRPAVAADSDSRHPKGPERGGPGDRR